MRSFDAWVLARLASGQPCDDLIEAMHPAISAGGQVSGGDGLVEPVASVRCYLAGQSDRDEVDKAVADADPLGPAPSLAADRRPACALDLDLAAVGVQWAWPGWIPRGRVSGSAGSKAPARLGSPSTWPGAPTTACRGPTVNR